VLKPVLSNASRGETSIIHFMVGPVSDSVGRLVGTWLSVS
jgi:hypothetical protein